MTTSTEVSKLIEKFDRNIDAYRSGHYSETHVRLEFIDPFFKALGWDIHNEQGIAEAYKDVIHEDAIKVGGATKAPDYCFRVGGTRKFFVEAKKPSVDIKGDVHPAYQLRRYAWSAKLPLSVLTDFEEFAVYDCRVRPVKTDTASTARVMYLTYEEYAVRWDELAEIFSRDAVWKGSFDKYVESTKRKRGTAEVDSVFLEEIEKWRDELARNIALRNTELSQHELNFSVQRTIDRIIFLRICEDRGIESYGQLRDMIDGGNTYSKLCRVFQRADERYNSGLFYFKKEKGRPGAPDSLTLNLVVDDKVLRDIIKNLYYPECPYEFSVLPTEILGHVYEQFLGKVIRLTPGHRAKVEEKPEVRKAGGVYYTPTYIVDYIVENTVGKLLKGKTPRNAAKLRIVDPACGSGSFLIGAFQYLLDWHRDHYVQRGPSRYKEKVQKMSGGEWRLTTPEKKRILLNNIYGVDIDPQAVEVTKLSLLLKVMEGESRESIETQLRLFHERALPDLGSNIRCGNSLIGLDFYDNEQITLLSEEENYRINPFDWEAEFPQVFRYKDANKRGFNAVIGNPPYVVVKGGRYTAFEESKPVIQYYKSKYRCLQQQANIYVAFLELSSLLASQLGYVGLIVPNTLLTNDFCEKIRWFLLDRTTLESLQNEGMVFQDAVVEGLIIIYKMAVPRTGNKIETKIADNSGKIQQEVFKDLTYRNRFLIHLTPDHIKGLTKIRQQKYKLADLFEVWRGLTTGNDAKYLYNTRLGDTYFPVVQGKHIHRYTIDSTPLFVNYIPHELDRPRPRRIFETAEKLISKFVTKRLAFAYDDQQRFVMNTACVIFARESTVESVKYLLGILNSSTMGFYFQSMFTDYRDVFPIVKSGHLEQFPVRTIDFSDRKDKAFHDKMVGLVNRMLDLNEKLQKAKTPHDREVFQRQIDATDRQIDRLVYELYDLTEEEIGIVEESLNQ